MKLYELILNISYGLDHVSRRYKTLSNAPSRQEKQKKVYNIILDVLLGVIFYCIVTNQSNALLVISSTLLVAAESTRSSLNQLLQWLMGAPAGLKLNRELSYFLGNFFLYHVEIWMTYLYFIQLYLPQVVTIVTCSSCLGLSLFLSLLNDVINMLTFHIYCFYVYAANLYYVQVQSLMSLARLFTGKKWNVLRLRVDSITYQADQLILGTILFTILLFLLPTTLLYYIVFAVTRLLVLLTQTFLSTAVELITRWPIYDTCMRVIDNQDQITDCISVDVKYERSREKVFKIDTSNTTVAHEEINVPVSFTIKKEQQTFADIITKEYNYQSPDVKKLFRNLCTGAVIQPWKPMKQYH